MAQQSTHTISWAPATMGSYSRSPTMGTLRRSTSNWNRSIVRVTPGPWAPECLTLCPIVGASARSRVRSGGAGGARTLSCRRQASPLSGRGWKDPRPRVRPNPLLDESAWCSWNRHEVSLTRSRGDEEVFTGVQLVATRGKPRTELERRVVNHVWPSWASNVAGDCGMSVVRVVFRGMKHVNIFPPLPALYYITTMNEGPRTI